MTAKRPRKRRSDSVYPDGAARQRAHRARRKAAREARLTELIDDANLRRLAAGLPPLRIRLDAKFYGRAGNLIKKAAKRRGDEEREAGLDELLRESDRVGFYGAPDSWAAQHRTIGARAGSRSVGGQGR